MATVIVQVPLAEYNALVREANAKETSRAELYAEMATSLRRHLDAHPDTSAAKIVRLMEQLGKPLGLREPVGV